MHSQAFFSVLTALAVALPAFASPMPTFAPPSPSQCEQVQDIVDAIKLVSNLAYPFCSSYISIPVVTVTPTSTRTSTPPPVILITTTTVPGAVTSTTTTITVTTITATIYSSYTPSAAGEKIKRDFPTIPAYFGKAVALQVSQACSCLSITPETTSITVGVVTTLAPATLDVTSTTTAPAVTQTTTVTTTVSAATTIPAACAPSMLATVYNEVGDQLINPPAQNYDSTFLDGTTPLDCCITCFNTPNCAFYQFFDSGPTYCILDTISQQFPVATDPAQAALCPAGIDPNLIMYFPAPPGTIAGFYPGVCLASSVGQF